MKRLDIKPRITNKLNVIQEENESENESDDESENESKQKQSVTSNRRRYFGPYHPFLKLKPGDTLNGMTYGSPYNPESHPKWKNDSKHD